MPHELASGETIISQGSNSRIVGIAYPDGDRYIAFEYYNDSYGGTWDRDPEGTMFLSEEEAQALKEWL